MTHVYDDKFSAMLKKLVYVTVSQEELKLAMYLIQKGADPNIRGTAFSSTILMCAIFAQNPLSYIKALITDCGCDIEAKDSDGNSAIHYALIGLNVPVVEWLFSNGLDINKKFILKNKTTLGYLHYFCPKIFDCPSSDEEKAIEIVKILIDKGANLLEYDSDGHLPIDLIGASPSSKFYEFVKYETIKKGSKKYIDRTLFPITKKI